jgi:hypothetical protein
MRGDCTPRKKNKRREERLGNRKKEIMIKKWVWAPRRREASREGTTAFARCRACNPARTHVGSFVICPSVQPLISESEVTYRQMYHYVEDPCPNPDGQICKSSAVEASSLLISSQLLPPRPSQCVITQESGQGNQPTLLLVSRSSYGAP